MVRRLLIFTFLAAATLLLAAVLAGWWILSTPAGARALLAGISALSGVEIKVGVLAGRLRDELLLEEVAARWSGGEARIGRVELSWRPERLLRGELAISRLQVQKADVHLADRPEERGARRPPGLAFPRLTLLPFGLEGEIGRFRLEEMTLHRPGGEPVQVAKVEARLAWRGDTLTVGNLRANSPAGEVRGEAEADFAAPALKINLAGEIAAAGGEGSWQSTADLRPLPGPRRLGGPFDLTAAAGGNRLQVAGRIDWSAERLTIDPFQVSRPEGGGDLQGSLEVRNPEDWQFSLELAANRLDLRPFVDFPSDLSGRLTAAGRLEDFRGELQLANQGPGWRRGSVRSSLRGNLHALHLPDLEGRWLDGRLRGSLAADWKTSPGISVDLQGEGLSPARVSSDWPGKINFSLRGRAQARTADQPAQAEIDARLHDSVLRGRPLAGELQASLAGDDLRISRLLLHGDGFDLAARGRLRERIDFEADIRRLSGLYPQGAGSLKAGGWVRWQGGLPLGQVTARGEGIVLGPLQAGALELRAAYPEAARGFQVAAEVRAFAYRNLQLTAATLRAAGTLADHDLRLSAEGPDVQFRGAASGGYAEGVWKGRVVELAGGNREFGRWTLEEGTAVAISPRTLRVAPFVLSGTAGERLQGSADLAFDPLRGKMEAKWRRLDLSMANRWLKNLSLDGRTTGEGEVRWLAADRLALQAQLEGTGTVILPEQRIAIPRVKGRIDWRDHGLVADWQLQLGAGGGVTGELRSPEAGHPGIPRRGEGWAEWRDFDLGLLSPWFRQGEVQGASSGRVQGKWKEGGRQLDLAGRLSLAGRLAWRELDVRIRQAEADFAWGDRGLSGHWELLLAEQGELRGRIAASGPPGPAMIEAGEIEAEWKDLDLALLAPLLPETELAGRAEGRLGALWGPDKSLDLEARLALAGQLAREGMRLDLRQAGADIRWDRSGLRSEVNLVLTQGGRLAGVVSSAEPGRLAPPRSGRLDAEWQDLDLALLRPWMPEAMLVEGKLAGQMEGSWRPGPQLDLSGQATVRQGELQWDSGDGVITAALRQAETNWKWAGDRLSGTLVLALADYGQLRGAFDLPLPATFPTSLQQEGSIEAELRGSLQEQGLLTSLFPGLLLESRGRLAVDLRVGGTWGAPDLGGTAQLTEAGGYLPTAGIRLSEVSVQARLAGEQVEVEHFTLHSGSGHLEGTAVLDLEEWRLHGYRAQVKGKDFQLAHLPELELLVTPDLTVEGNRERLVVRGEVLLPQVLVRGRESAAPITPSPDVIIVDAPQKPARTSTLAIDGQVRVVLGKSVLVQAEGIDARLEGSLRLTLKGVQPDQITAQGEIKVAQGTYSTYGVKLKIERGALLFAGGPVDRPTLDILALRTVGDVKAGVRVTGTPRAPEARLTSDPSMPDTEILSYIVLGHPVGAGSGNVGLLMTAAGALLSKGESAVLQDRLKRTFGLDVLELESGSGDIQGSQITIGKYLSPELYLSFGQSLFTNANEVRLRYDLTQKWQLESSVGNESAVDLYYKIEFR